MSLSLSEAMFCLLVAISTFYQAGSQSISIIRGENDIFTNVSGCQPSKAACFDRNCTKCQCKEEGTTFLRRNDTDGECISNRRLANWTSVKCATFESGSHLVILNKTKCQGRENHTCLGRNETNVNLRNITGCSLLLSQAQYLHNDRWKTLLVQNDIFDVITTGRNKVFLKWNLTKTPKSWNGLIVKVQFQCKSDGEENSYCVLIKYTGQFTGFDATYGGNRDEKDTSQTTAIVVSVLVIAFVFGVLIFLAYKHRTRLITFIQRNAEKYATRNVRRDHASAPASGASSNPIYHVGETRSAQKKCELYEQTVPEPVYQYAYAGYANRALQPTNATSTAEYATPGEEINTGRGVDNGGGVQGGNVVSQNATEPQNVSQSSPVYHVLERN